MAGWAGIALALGEASDDDMVSRLPTFLHPLAGRSLAWHVIHAMATAEPPPLQLLLISEAPVDPSVLGGLPAESLVVGQPSRWWQAAAPRLRSEVEQIVVLDAATAPMASSLGVLAAGPPNRALRDETGTALAVCLRPDDPRLEMHRAGSMEGLAADCHDAAPPNPGEVFAVRNRQSLARAGILVRDRLVRRLMEAGVTFLVPETVLVDVDVVVGPDTVIYPGVVLEGQTSIGAETVVGPCCRIIDSTVGNGAELKGWNYLVGTSIRNRAVLEPYVRRGFD